MFLFLDIILNEIYFERRNNTVMWIDDFVSLNFPTDPKLIRFKEAQELKFQHIPNALYRYRTIRDYNIKNLKNGIEWMSYPKDFNDPFDAGLNI